MIVLLGKETLFNNCFHFDSEKIVSMKSVVSHFSASKMIYLHCSFHITNCISSSLFLFFHLPVPEAALLKVIYHISPVSSSVLV